MVRPEPCSLEQKGMPLDRNQPARSKWLQEGGPGEDNLYYLCCSICSTKVAACKLQSRLSNSMRPDASARSTEMARDSGQEGCVARLPGCSCTAHSSALCRAGQTANLKTRLVGLRTYQCWYMLYICFRAMPETFDSLRARTLLGSLPAGWA